MPLKAILLGSLGALADTSEMQRRAFNAAFAEAGLGWEWTRDQYQEISAASDCSERINEHIVRYAKFRRQTVDAGTIRRRKAEIFREFLPQVSVPPRPSLRSLLRAARGAGLRVGLVTTCTPEDVETMLAVTGLGRATFDFVGDESMVRRPKPSPDIYLAALDALQLAPHEALAIEDTQQNAGAAKAAGIRCATFPGAIHLPLGAVSVGVEAMRAARPAEPPLARLA